MEKPFLYIKSSNVAQKDGNYVLNNNLKLLQANTNYSVLDVGCGPGNITYKKILPLLPNTTKKIIGVDISTDNIEYAKKHYQTDSRISYKQMDILTDNIPNEFVDSFDLILSLYCFHLVGDHRKVFNNIYKMLKPGGKMLISFVRESQFPDMYQKVYENPKWRKYMSNFDDVVFMPQPEEFYVALFEEIGFNQIQYEKQENKVLQLEDHVINILRALNLFTVPKCLEKEFIESHLEFYQNNEYVKFDDEGKKRNCTYVMEKPMLYIKNSILAQEDADYVLNKNFKLLQASENCVVLDVGCGPGNVTYEKVLPLLPSTTKEVIGIDILSDNIDYARKHYQTDSRVSYEQLDILTDSIPNEYVGAFDLILSLYCFHFVGNHRKALNNIYKMLKPGGKVLISFMEKSLISKMYQYVYDKPKWSKYMSNFHNAVFKTEPKESLKTLFKEIGFCQIQCEAQDKNLLHSEDGVIGMVTSLNLFNVPEYLEQEFVQNHLEFFQNNNHVSVDDQGRKLYDFPHTLMQTDPRISFEEMDILTDRLPNEYIATFDLIVSLFCFHLIGDHRKALKNIYKMLKPGGKILINFIDKSVLPNMYQYVYDNPKWTKYMSNFDEVVPKNHSYEPKKLYEEIGFSQFQCDEQENYYLYGEDASFGTLKSVNLFNVPEDLETEFIENQLEYYEKNGYVTYDDKGKKQYHLFHTNPIITANKY
ncbi:hypothetical protein RN001_014416 [Aquatica leii]|uniref:Methyltransferase domain-containing protein n=1 Tax=Aquatica leii TaxID=1421715 RepID=A0AAN7SBF2_9COLE|nr:hypothetical protein RN001_014416 [Aquatica leii]